jgi:hypothetical protein
MHQNRLWFKGSVGLMVTAAVVAGLLVLTRQADAQSREKPVVQDRWRPIHRPFELNVLVNGRPLTEYHARGRTYIEAIQGAEYELEIRNPLPYRVAVALSVDGLNSIDARHTSAWNASKWVIEPYGRITIGGWQMSSERARRFYFTDERDSYAAKLGQTANIGVISAVFFRERRKYPTPITPPTTSGREQSDSRPSKSPSNEAAGQGRALKRAPIDEDYAATGIGRSVRNDVRWIEMDLDSQPAAELMIRYEYSSALRRLGVVPRPYVVEPDPLRRREQSRGFSPEP